MVVSRWLNFLHCSSGLSEWLFLESKVFYDLASKILQLSNILYYIFVGSYMVSPNSLEWSAQGKIPGA